MARRVESAGIIVEQKPVNVRRVEGAGILVETGSSPNMRRVSGAGILVEWEPIEGVVVNGIESTEAFGTPVLTGGAVGIAPPGIASAEAFGTPTLSETTPVQTLYPTGIASANVVGTPTVTLINYETFHEYVVLDEKRYRTVHKTWSPQIHRPMLSRELLNGNLDATFGPSTYFVWEGEVVAPTSVEDSDWGTITDLRATLKKKQAVSFHDHYGSHFAEINLFGPYPERSPSPMWDDEAPIYVKIRIKARA